MDVLDRFQAKVKKTESCWEWQAATNGKYGLLRVNSIYELAHRVSYKLFKGAIPNGLVVMHSCDNPLCVNPEHLSLGTQKENLHDMTRKGRNPLRKLTNEQVAEIREFLTSGKLLHREIAAKYGVHKSVVGRIARNEIYLI